MKARKIENISRTPVLLKLKGGPTVALPSQASLEYVNITNEAEIRGKVIITGDLTEVRENTGKKQLRD